LAIYNLVNGQDANFVDFLDFCLRIKIQQEDEGKNKDPARRFWQKIKFQPNDEAKVRLKN
jgi:hypothetical protein